MLSNYGVILSRSLGNMQTSRTFAISNRTCVNLSSPIDQPACGGAPKRNESMYGPKSFGFSSFAFSLFSSSSGMWIRWLPDEISIPL